MIKPSFEVMFLYSVIWQLASLRRNCFFSLGMMMILSEILELWIEVRMQDKVTVNNISF